MVADGVEDAALSLHVGMVHRGMLRVMERRVFQLGDLHDVTQREEPVHCGYVLLLVQAELRRKTSQVLRCHSRRHFHANHRSELAFAKARLDEGQEVVRFFLVHHGIGVARDAELLATVDLHSGE